MRTSSIALLVSLSAVSALSIGVVVGRAWGDHVERARQREQQAQLTVLGAQRSAERRAALDRRLPVPDSALERWRTRREPPLELSRVQAGPHCLFTLAFTAPHTPEPPRPPQPRILELRVEEAYVAPEARTLGMHLPVGAGWAYLPAVPRAGETTQVVVPYTACGMTVVHGHKMTDLRPSPPVRVFQR